MIFNVPRFYFGILAWGRRTWSSNTARSGRASTYKRQSHWIRASHLTLTDMVNIRSYIPFLSYMLSPTIIFDKCGCGYKISIYKIGITNQFPRKKQLMMIKGGPWWVGARVTATSGVGFFKSSSHYIYMYV